MNKKLILMCSLISTSMFADYSVNEGWNLLGSVKKLDNSFFNKDNINIVWTFSQNESESKPSWKFYSPDENVTAKALSKNYIQLDSLEEGNGFWLYSKSNSTISFEPVAQNYEYLAKVVYLENNELVYPLSFADIYDKDDKFIGKTDKFGNFPFMTDGKYSAKSLGFDDLEFFISKKGISLVEMQKKNTIKEQEQTQLETSNDYLYDIKNWYEDFYDTSVAAAVIPKVFYNASKSAALVVKKFSVNSDVTISIEEKLSINLPEVLSFSIGLEDSFAQEVSKEDVGFVGEFKPIGIKKDLDTTKQYALYFRENSSSDWIFLENVSYNEHKGILKPKNFYTQFGEYSFRAFDRLNSVNGIVKDSEGNLISEFYILEDNGNIVPFKDGKFDFKHTDTKSIKIFADGYVSQSLQLENQLDIVLEKQEKQDLEINIHNIFLSSNSEDELILEVEHNISNLPNKFILIKQNETSYIIKDFPTSLIGKSAKLNNTNVIIDSQMNLYTLPSFDLLETSKKSIEYSDMLKFSDYLVSISSNGLIEYFDINTKEKLSEIKLNAYIFDSYFVNEEFLYVASFGGEIYKIDKNMQFEIVYSTENSFVTQGSSFIYKPIIINDIKYIPTSKGNLVKLDKTNSLLSEPKISNSANIIYNISNKLISIGFDGVIKSLDNNSITQLHDFEESLTANKVIQYNNNIYISTSLGIFMIDELLEVKKVSSSEASQMFLENGYIFIKTNNSLEVYTADTFELQTSILLEENFIDIISNSEYYLAFTTNKEIVILNKDNFSFLSKVNLDMQITNISKIGNDIFIKNKESQLIYFKN